jgi:hypothetical protein
MPSFTARVYDLPWVGGGFSGSGFFTARMWPQGIPDAALVTNVAPAVLTQQSSGFTWQADVTGELGEILLWVSFEGLNVVEMVYDGSDFCPNYKALSTLVQIVALPQVPVNRITVRRSNGWPANPQFFLRARTKQGGVNE